MEGMQKAGTGNASPYTHTANAAVVDTTAASSSKAPFQYVGNQHGTLGNLDSQSNLMSDNVIDESNEEDLPKDNKDASYDTENTRGIKNLGLRSGLQPCDVPRYLEFLRNEHDPRGRLSILCREIWKIVKNQGIVKSFEENKGLQVLNGWMNDDDSVCNDANRLEKIRRLALRFLIMGLKYWNIYCLDGSGITKTLQAIAKDRKTEIGLYVLAKEILERFGRAGKIGRKRKETMEPSSKRQSLGNKFRIRWNDEALNSVKRFYKDAPVPHRRSIESGLTISSLAGQRANALRVNGGTRRNNVLANSLKRKPNSMEQYGNATSSNNVDPPPSIPWRIPPKFRLDNVSSLVRGTESGIVQEWNKRESNVAPSSPESGRDDPYNPPLLSPTYEYKLEDVPEIRSVTKKFMQSNSAAVNGGSGAVDYERLYNHVTDDSVQDSIWAAERNSATKMVIDPPPSTFTEGRTSNFSPRGASGGWSTRPSGYRQNYGSSRNFRGVS